MRDWNPVEDRVGRRPRVLLRDQSPLPTTRRSRLHHRGEASLRQPADGRRTVASRSSGLGAEGARAARTAARAVDQPPLGARVGVGVTGDASWLPASLDGPLCGALVVASAPRSASLLDSSVAVGSAVSVDSLVDVSVVSVGSVVLLGSVVSVDTGRGSTTRPTDVPVAPRASVDPLSSSTPVTASSPMRNTPTVSAVRTTQRRRGPAGEAGDTADSTAVGWSVNPVGVT